MENLLKINLYEYEAENRALRVQVNQLNRENAFLRSKYTELIDILAQIGFNLPKKLYLADANDSDIKAQIEAICADIDKAAKARVRKATLELEELGKAYRKESVK